MGGGGSQKGSSVQTTSGSGAPQIVPEFQPFAKRVGEIALGAVDYPELNMRRFAQDQTLPVAGLSPLELQARGMVQERGTMGIPVPFPERAAFGSTAGAIGTAGHQAQRTSGAGQGLISPLTQNALQGLEASVRPVIENSAAKFGLAQSGALPAELGRSYARELAPIYQEGMRQEAQGLQNLASTQMQATNPFLQMGAREEQRPIQQMNELTSMGELERNVEQAQGLADMDSYIRARELALGLVNPFGSFASSPQIPSSVTTQTKSSGGGGGMFSK